VPQAKLPRLNLGPGLARFVRQWLLLALWLAAGWLGFDSLDRIRDAYQFACADTPCRNIDAYLGFLGLSVLANLIAIPWLIGLLIQIRRKP
jgi:hypothetical protein